MYKVDFLEALREKIKDKSTDDLKSLVIQLAKQLPSNLYVEVLSEFDSKSEKVKKIEIETTNLFTEIEELCEEIEDGHYTFDWHFGHDYYDEEDELIDEDGLGKKLNSLFQKVIKIAQNEQYEEAYELFGQLFSISVYNEYDDITVEQLFDEGLISTSYSHTLYTYAHCALMCKRGAERASALFNIVLDINFNLEDLLKFGAELIPDEETFYQEWIEYLKNRVADARGKRDIFLIEALTNSGGINSLRRFVTENGMLYPDVVFKLLQLDIQDEDFIKAVETIKKGFKEMVQIDKHRIKLADYLIEISKKTDNEAYFKEGIIEGFKSSLDLKYYVEIYNLQDSKLTFEMLEYLEANKKEEIVNPFDYYCIQFLNGNYSQVWNECAKDLNPLGWSGYYSAGSLKGRMFPLFLALLTKGKLGKVTLNLLKQMRYDLNHSDFIYALTSSMKELSDEEYREYLSWCKSQIKLRVDAIVGGGKRKSYEKASALIVAMGEVLMANYGELTGINYIREFKLAYPRHSAFQKCLRDDLLLIGKSL